MLNTHRGQFRHIYETPTLKLRKRPLKFFNWAANHVLTAVMMFPFNTFMLHFAFELKHYSKNKEQELEFKSLI